MWQLLLTSWCSVRTAHIRAELQRAMVMSRVLRTTCL